MSVPTVPSGPIVPANAGQAPPRLFKMFAALSAINEAILRINSKEKLFQQVCDAALQSGNFIAAVILLREPGTENLEAVAGAGNDAELRACSYPSSSDQDGEGRQWQGEKPSDNACCSRACAGSAWRDVHAERN